MEVRAFLLVMLLLAIASFVDSSEEPDEDFPDDGAPDADFRAPASVGPETSAALEESAQRPSPVSVYVIRLLEILLGVENVHRSSTRVTRAARQNMFIEGAFAGSSSVLPPSSSSSSSSSSSDSGRNTGASYSNYYDFLINEGSYKFWAFFQLSTAALLVYSAFAALYYARYTYYTSVDYSDYDDYFFRRSGRTARSLPGLPPPPPSQAPFAGLNPITYRKIMDAVSGVHKSSKTS